jgi:tetratricopeptide (TPR) repeat protein
MKTFFFSGIIEKKLLNFEECIRLFEITIDYLKINLLSLNKTIHNYFKFIDIYFKLNLNLINSYLNLKKHKTAHEYAQSLLDFTLKEQSYLAKQQDDDKLRETSFSIKLYLKFIEIYSISKLGLCYEKLRFYESSLKLYERELKLINKYFKNNYLLKIRSFMHCANINYLLKNYAVTIGLYKDILSLIEVNCKAEMASNRKLVKFSFYALTNLAECMKTLGKYC